MKMEYPTRRYFIKNGAGLFKQSSKMNRKC
jgi:hypothetical protein